MLAESPEVEVMCGGINTKRPSHAGIWRQGNLLHFGFETPPSRLNENGRAVLVNSIAYISRFTEDFPLTRTPSVFADDRYPRARASVEELLEAFPPKNLAGNFDPDLHVERMTKPTFEQWFRKSFAYLHPGELGLLEIDNDAEAFKMSFGDPAFVRMAVAALDEEGEKAKLAHRLLQRYVDQPPAQNASFEKWAEWFDENCDYLFFSEASGYKWHIDTLAKDRGVPTEKLRGPLRATLPPPRLVTAER